MSARWASQIFDGHRGDVFDAVRLFGPVMLIATNADALRCRPTGIKCEAIEADADLVDFDQIPLVGSSTGRIEGMYVRGQGCVPLNADMFMAADAPLLAFLETADSKRFRLLLEGGDVAGMVTLSDLQRLPVFPLVFGLVVAVEVLLVDWIRRRCAPEPNLWLTYLNENQRGQIERNWKDAVANNFAIDRLSCASLNHELQAADALGLFESECDFKREFEALRKLRDRVCHAMEFVLTPELALTLPQRAREAQVLADWLQKKVAGVPR